MPVAQSASTISRPIPSTNEHPSFCDPAYRARREAIGRASASGALRRIGYTPSENATWRAVLERLVPLHARRACEAHLRGFERLGIETERAPELVDLDACLRRETGFSIRPTDGLLSTRDFFAALAARRMPCTQYLRHATQPEYTPEPDMVHEVIGHLSVLADRRVADTVQRFAQRALRATEEGMVKLERRYWFTFEYGLVLERGELRAFGAGVLSSIAEMESAFSSRVELRAADARAMEAQSVDTMRLQETLFVAPSVDALLDDLLDAPFA
jgi:phenylalanine-4-hydroxylase